MLLVKRQLDRQIHICMHSSRYRYYLQPISKEKTFFFSFFPILLSPRRCLFFLMSFFLIWVLFTKLHQGCSTTRKINGNYPRYLLLSLFLSSKAFLNTLLTYTGRFSVHLNLDFLLVGMLGHCPDQRDHFLHPAWRHKKHAGLKPWSGVWLNYVCMKVSSPRSDFHSAHWATFWSTYF